MEWLFLTCHNYWIVCRLVRDNNRPFLAYSPMISIEDSSEPFRALLGAILSVLKGVDIEPSSFNPDMQLDTIIEDHSGDNRGSPSKGGATEPLMIRSRARVAGHDNAEHGLMVCPFVGGHLLWLSHFALRLLLRPPARLSLSKYGFICKHSRTTRSPFLCLIGMGNDACG